MNLLQGGEIALGVSLVHAMRCATVAQEVLGAGKHRRGISERGSL